MQEQEASQEETASLEEAASCQWEEEGKEASVAEDATMHLGFRLSITTKHTFVANRKSAGLKISSRIIHSG